MKNETRVNKINKIENAEVNLQFYKNKNKDQNNSNKNQQFSENLKIEMDKYNEKINNIKEKEMICAIDLLIEDFNIDEIVQIFEFSYQEFYNYVNKKLKLENKDMYNYVMKKIKQDNFERNRHK